MSDNRTTPHQRELDAVMRHGPALMAPAYRVSGSAPWRQNGPLVMWSIGVLSHLHYRGDCAAAWDIWTTMSAFDQGAWLNTAERMLRGDYCNG